MTRKFLIIILMLVQFCGIGRAKEESAIELSGKAASFEKAQRVLQTSCMPCHSAQLPLPWYGRLPLIKQRMKEDYLKAMEGLNLDSQVYVVGQPPSGGALNKIEQALEKGTMPPRLYVMSHLSSRISQQEKWAILNWIRDERAKTQLSVPLPPQILPPSSPPQEAEPVSKPAAIPAAPAKHLNPFKPFDS